MEYIKNNIKILIQKKTLDKNQIQTFLNYSVVKIICKDNTELSYQEMPFVASSLKRKFPGQTYITIPFNISFGGNDENIALENAKETSFYGECKVSKRDIRSQYSMLKANKDEVLEKAYELSQYALNQFSNLLNGNVFDITITDLSDGKEKYKFGNLIVNEDNFYNTLITDILPIDLEVRKALQGLIASKEFKDIFNTNSVRHLFEK